jgi:hypothetical protein
MRENRRDGTWLNQEARADRSLARLLLEKTHLQTTVYISHAETIALAFVLNW